MTVKVFYLLFKCNRNCHLPDAYYISGIRSTIFKIESHLIVVIFLQDKDYVHFENGNLEVQTY